MCLVYHYQPPPHMEHCRIHILRDPFHSGRCPACSGIRNQGDAQRIQLMTFSFAVVHRIPYENEVRRWNLCVFLSFRLTFYRGPKSAKNLLRIEVGKRREKSSGQNGQGSGNGRLQHRSGEGVEGPGKGIGGRVNPS